MSAASDTGYAPRPGTAAHRILGLLEDEAPREFSVAQICERLPGVELHAVKPCLAPAVEHGIVSRRQKADGPRAPFWYRLASAGTEEFHQGASTAIRARAEGVATPASAGAVAQLPAVSSPHYSEVAAPDDRPHGQPAGAAPATKRCAGNGIRFALWSDGELHILRERDAEPILLSRDETRALVAYLDRVLSLEAAT